MLIIVLTPVRWMMSGQADEHAATVGNYALGEDGKICYQLGGAIVETITVRRFVALVLRVRCEAVQGIASP